VVFVTKSLCHIIEELLISVDILPAWWLVTIYWYFGSYQSAWPHSGSATWGSKTHTCIIYIIL